MYSYSGLAPVPLADYGGPQGRLCQNPFSPYYTQPHRTYMTVKTRISPGQRLQLHYTVLFNQVNFAIPEERLARVERSVAVQSVRRLFCGWNGFNLDVQ